MSTAHESFDDTSENEKKTVPPLSIVRDLGDRATPPAPQAPTWWGPEQSAKRRSMLADNSPLEQFPDDN